MTETRRPIYAVSDATGDLAISVAMSGVRQFKQNDSPIFRRAKIRTPERVDRIIQEARENSGLIVFTIVNSDLRNYLQRVAAEHGVTAVNIMGTLLETLEKHFESAPLDQPGLRYQINHDYFRRNEAIEFTVKHDDGLGLETLSQADMVLLGISRTSKTPLSIYLSYRGFKTANVPLVMGVELPSELSLIEKGKRVGLTIDPHKLVELRVSRLRKLGRPVTGAYADIEAIRDELAYAHKIFSRLGPMPVIDVTSKALEEVATEILAALGKSQNFLGSNI